MSQKKQAGLANVFQGPLMDALKTALKALQLMESILGERFSASSFQEPSKVGLSLFGTAIDIVSSIIQDVRNTVSSIEPQSACTGHSRRRFLAEPAAICRLSDSGPRTGSSDDRLRGSARNLAAGAAGCKLLSMQ